MNNKTILLNLNVYAKVNCLFSLTLLHVLMLLFHECILDMEQWMHGQLLDNASHAKTKSGIKIP